MDGMGLAKCDRRVASPTGTGRARQWLRSAPDNDTATITAVSHDFMCSQDLYDAVWARKHTGTVCGVVRFATANADYRGSSVLALFPVPVRSVRSPNPGCGLRDGDAPPGSCSWPAGRGRRRWLVGRRTTTVLGAGAAPARGRYTTAETDLRGNR